MLRNRFVPFLAVLLAATVSSSCSEGGYSTTGGEIDAVSIVALNRTVTIGATVQAEGRAFTRDNISVPGSVSWSVSNAAILSVSGELITTGSTVVNRATVTGLAAGKANLIATAGSKTASVEIVVVSGAP
ncbi:MAG TPA: hypothetical protein VMY38_02995 [Gemmatimonadaceae bacterium]|nr:hypothetical protein [Gemmatimonadaceae bacterium]